MVTSGAQPVNSMRVLHIDDNPDYMAITKMYLESFDPEMEVVSSFSPVDSLPLIENMEFDCVLCDYLMPEMDGIELCRRVRRTSDVPFIIHTGHGSEEVASIAFDAGVDDYIRKEPGKSHFQVLAKRVRQAVEKHWVEGLYRNVLENCRDGVVIVQGTRIAYANQALAKLRGVSLGELEEKDALDWVVERDRSRLQSIALGRQRGESQPSPYEVTFRRPDGEHRVLDISSSLISYKGRPASLGIVRDVSEKVRDRERLEALHGCTIGLASAESIEEIAKQTLDCITEVFDFQMGEFSILEAGRMIPVLFKGVTYEVEILDLDGPGVIARAARTGESQLVPETRVDEDYIPTFIDDDITTLSELAVPIKSNGNVIGVINLESPVLGGFSVDDQKLLEIFSRYVASGVARIRNEGLLKASEEKYRSILESSLDGITVSRNSKTVFANQRFAEMLGYDAPSEVLGRSSWEFVGPEYQELVKERGAKRAKGDRSTFRYEYCFVTKDGSPFYAETQTSAIDFEGEPAVLGIHRDVNERVRLREESRRSAELLKSFMDSAPDGFSIFDSEMNYLDVNKSLVARSGDPKEHFIGKNILDVLPNLDKTGRLELYREVLETGNPVFLNVPSSSHSDQQLSIRAFKMGEGLGIITTDISEQKRLEDERLRYEERLEALHRHSVELALVDTVDDVADVTLDGIVDVFGHQILGFCQVDGDSLNFTHSRGVHSPEDFKLPLDGKGLTVRAVRTGESQRVGDVRTSLDYTLGWDHSSQNFRSELDVPVKIEGEVVAVLNIESDEVDHFTPQDQTLLEIFADHVASAISRIRRDERLRKSEEKYRALMESSLDAVTVSVDNKIIYSNKRCLEILGYDDISELKGMRFLDFIHPEDRETAKETYKRRSKGERGPINYTVRVRGKDGQYKYIESRTNGIEYEGREAILSIARDITKRTRLEEELRESERRYRSVFVSTNEGIIVTGPGGRIMSANQAAADFLGFDTPEELLKSTTHEFYAEPEQREMLMKELMEQEIVTDYEVTARRADGSLRIGQASYAVHKDEEGRILRIEGIFRDVTDRKRMEEELRASEERYKSLFALSPFAIVISDMKGRITDVNDAVIQMAGFPRDELIGKHFSKLPVFSKRDIPRYLKIFSSFMGGNPPEPLEISVHSRDDVPGILELHAGFVELEGEKVGIQAIFKDITLQKQMEEELRRENSEKKAILDAIPDAVSLKGSDYRFIWVNEALAASASSTPEKLIGKICYEAIYGRQEPCDYCLFRKVLASGIGARDRITFTDGRVIDVAVEPIHDDSDKIIASMQISRDISDQMRMEEELRRSEERYRSLIELAPDGIMTLNLKGEVTSINPAFMRLTGYSENEIVGPHFSKLRSAGSLKDMPKYLKMFAGLLRGKTPSLVEFDYRRKDGTFGRGEALSQIAEVEPGKREILSILRDISDRKRMEEELRNHSERLEELVSERTSELRESEERFRNVIDNLPMGVHMYKIDANGDFRFVGANPTADEMQGIPGREYIGKTIDEVLPHFSDTEIHGRFKEIAEEGGFWHEENIRYEGDRIIGALDNYNFQTSPGEMASVFRDVTEQKRMEEALKASEAKYRSFLEEGLDGVVVTWNGEYLYVNQRYAEMLGYSDPSELLGRNTREVIDPRDAERLDAIREQRQSGDMQRLTYEGRSLKKDGSSIWVGVASSGIEFEGKQAVITYARDITERKRREESLLAAERLAVVGRIAAMMGHDLRGPLVVVRNAVNLARQNPEKTDRMLDMIERNTGQAIDILEELWTMTRDEPVSLKPVEIEKLLRKITEDLILPTGVGLSLEIDEDLQEIALDETKTVRALKNIIQNAIDAMPDGGELKIEATSKDDQVVISVSDTGTGISDEARRNLFKPFYTTKPKGMGLGLASTRRLVEVQGGTISFESKDGKGATFAITLPLKEKNPKQ